MAKNVRVSALRPKVVAKKKQRNGASFPGAGRAKKPAAPKDTKEGLIVEMGALLDEVDALLPSLKEIGWSWPDGKLLKLKERSLKITERMTALLADGPIGRPRTYGHSSKRAFQLALSAPMGTVPSPARPGAFVRWIGYVPVLCLWGGFSMFDHAMHAVDPAEKWMTSSGVMPVHQTYLDPDSLDISSVFRAMLQTKADQPTGLFDLVDLNDTAKEQVTERLKQHQWLQDALVKGPVDPIGLPARFLALQQKFL